jgi:hypothetical protein
MPSMSTDPDARDGAVPPDAAADPDGNADASPPASPQKIYEETMVRFAVITEEWQKARDALLRG